MKFRRYRGYASYSSFNHFEKMKRLFPYLHLNVFHRFLEEILVIPFYPFDKKFLKKELPEGHILKTSRLQFEKAYVVIVFMNEVKKK